MSRWIDGKVKNLLPTKDKSTPISYCIRTKRSSLIKLISVDLSLHHDCTIIRVFCSMIFAMEIKEYITTQTYSSFAIRYLCITIHMFATNSSILLFVNVCQWYIPTVSVTHIFSPVLFYQHCIGILYLHLTLYTVSLSSPSILIVYMMSVLIVGSILLLSIVK